MVSWLYAYVRLIELYSLSMCSLLNFSYSGKYFKNPDLTLIPSEEPRGRKIMKAGTELEKKYSFLEVTFFEKDDQ